MDEQWLCDVGERDSSAAAYLQAGFTSDGLRLGLLLNADVPRCTQSELGGETPDNEEATDSLPYVVSL